jgi:glycosyltransferase involved in cell wall biosynthesis
MTKPLRIAFLTPEFITELTGEGGLATYVSRITQVLRNMGHEPEVFTLAKAHAGVIDFNGIRVERVLMPNVRIVRWLRRLSCFHRCVNLDESIMHIGTALGLAHAFTARNLEKPFDFVQCSDFGLTGLFVQKCEGRPMLIRCSWARDLFTSVDGKKRTFDTLLLNSLERLNIRRADIAYSPSRFVAEYMWQNHRIKLEILRPPFFLERQPAKNVPDGLPPRYLIHFGLLGARKGTDLVAAALPLVWQEEPHFTMVWAGKEHGYPIVEESRRQWGEHADKVKWLGPIEKPILYAVLKKAEAAVLPSRCDNFPNTVIESLLFNIPVIGSHGASIDELLEPGVCGELVPIGDVPALAQAMIRVWRGERILNGRPTILREMNPKVAASNLINLAASVGLKSGESHIVRFPFSGRIENYLFKQEVRDSRVWKVFQTLIQDKYSILLLLFPTFFRLSNRIKLFLIGTARNMAERKVDDNGIPEYEGYLDKVDCNEIAGWAWNMNRPGTPIYVDIYDDGILLAILKANEYRQDLVHAGKGNGKYAFNCPVPTQLKDGKPHSILARVSGTNFDLVSTPKRINCGFEIPAKGFLSRMLKLLARRLV